MTSHFHFHFHFLLLVIAIISSPLLTTSQSTTTTTTEKQTLLKIKSEWGNPDSLVAWSNSTSVPYCSWPGITCAADNASVAEIILPDQGLSSAIPAAVCDLRSLSLLNLTNNSLPGPFPTLLCGCSALRTLDISQNLFVGDIASGVACLPPRLARLVLAGNNFSGDVPAALGRLDNLQELHLDNNLFDGTVAPEIGNLTQLRILTLACNPLAPAAVPAAIRNLTRLQFLWMSSMNLEGEIPAFFAEMSELAQLDLSQNSLSGGIPEGIWTIRSLQNLYLYKNQLSGQISVNGTIGSTGLVKLDVSMNHITGTIPESFGSLRNLSILFMYYNRLAGEIPASIGLLPSLTDLRLFNNNLTGVLPPQLGKHSPLWNVEVDDNMLSGELPEGLCAGGAFTSIVVSANNMSGPIPAGLGECATLDNIQIQGNRFSGDVPAGIWAAENLTTVIMHNNELSGGLPDKLPWNLTRLEIDNNQFTGNLPSSAGRLVVFKSSNNKFSGEQKDRSDPAGWKLTSFQALNFAEGAVIRGLKEENLIGSGGGGRVYKVALGNSAGGTVAVKKIWNTRRVDAKLEREFESEVKILGSIRHTNIVKLLCCISSSDSKLLVYEYMENGSLDRWLHGRGTVAASRVWLDWPTRLRIALGAAQGLCYMHHECSTPIVHRDVKSSNVLLDSEFKARIADFGLARMLVRAGEPDSVSALAGSFGYMAPECAYTRKVNEKVDVYSFGVVLLELTTGREASDGGDRGSLAEWAWQHLQEGNKIADAVDRRICEPSYQCEVEAVFKLGIICTGTLPSTRPTMKEVVQILQRCEQNHKGFQDKRFTENDVIPLLQTRRGSRRKGPSDADGDDDGKGFDCNV
ncbi:Receptor protein kinase CLAVATA1 [Ananas comosus]|uniref:Receptor protein kinase CLAVATA1 n=1 Tax=Ananas comosus TaxID=4615 RepID=A0A199VYY1_ANACO|nr:Receptor protein kinase CLAVATA1 [Ananas comosus]